MNEKNKPHMVVGDLHDEGRADLAGDGASIELPDESGRTVALVTRGTRHPTDHGQMLTLGVHQCKVLSLIDVGGQSLLREVVFNADRQTNVAIVDKELWFGWFRQKVPQSAVFMVLIIVIQVQIPIVPSTIKMNGAILVVFAEKIAGLVWLADLIRREKWGL